MPFGPRYINFFETISILAGESSSGSDRGIAHFFMAQEIQSREWEERTKNKRTIRLWSTQLQEG